ncbi:hypothetical protein, partial [Halomonas marinisediminis]|uniref:hypothetical protein n=1 Tax=Halomonas marinisediminis TaxID=2546095 RepID=UPI00197AB393
KESRDDEATIPDDDIPLALPKPKPAYKPSKRSTKALSSILKNLIPKPTAALPTEEPAKDKQSATPSKPGHAAHRLSDRDTVRLQDAIRQQ